MTPAYNIKVGKAADRLLFREMLLRLSHVLELNQYKYVGLGGPFLEDFRLIHEAFPTMSLTSIEKTKQVWLRQQFHKPANHVDLQHSNTDAYFAHVHDESERVIVWLDYTNLRHSLLQEIWGLIPKLAPGSILRVTLRAEGTDAVTVEDRATWATDIFGKFEPQYESTELDTDKFSAILLRSIKRLVDDVGMQTPGRKFQLLHAFTYADKTQMLTFCGIVVNDDLEKDVRDALQSWSFKNFDWSDPWILQLPSLSLKERLTLEPLIPCADDTGRELHEKLGYYIEDNEKNSLAALNQYRLLAEAYPRFVRIVF